MWCVKTHRLAVKLLEVQTCCEPIGRRAGCHDQDGIGEALYQHTFHGASVQRLDQLPALLCALHYESQLSTPHEESAITRYGWWKRQFNIAALHYRSA
jgi:hypothetical protein